MDPTRFRNAILATATVLAVVTTTGLGALWSSSASARCACAPPPSRGGGPASGWTPTRSNIPTGPTMGPRIQPPVNIGIRAAQDAAANATRQVRQDGPDTALIIDDDDPGGSVSADENRDRTADPTANPAGPRIDERMVDTVRDWEEETGVKVVNGIDPNNPIPHVGWVTVDMGRFVKDEEGTVKPMRTGGEVDM